MESRISIQLEMKEINWKGPELGDSKVTLERSGFFGQMLLPFQTATSFRPSHGRQRGCVCQRGYGRQQETVIVLAASWPTCPGNQAYILRTLPLIVLPDVVVIEYSNTAMLSLIATNIELMNIY